MSKTQIVLSLSMILLSACASRQKSICVQNVAYQHGYQAALKGQSVNNAATNQAQICQDYAPYPPSLYRSDFKAGYEKGIREYCSEVNYQKWGTDDGKQGKVDFPNNYSEAMNVCLQDSQYKKSAKTIYQKAFNQAYCDDNRLSELGQQQAQNFEPLKTPNINKLCGNKSASMLAAMKTAYKEQMKTNCTPAFWLLKGEEDAKAKRSKSSEMSKVQKCPSAVRDQLITQYSQAYNERKALLLEEDKLAFEKQKQQQQLELERQKQQQQYELEKEKLQLVKDTLNHHGGSGTGWSRPSYFYHNGLKFSVSCHIDQGRHDAIVRVRNEGNRKVTVSGRWQIVHYGANNQILRTSKKFKTLMISGLEIKEFRDVFSPRQAQHCSARKI